MIGDRLRAFIHLPDIGSRPALPFAAAAHRLDARNQFAAAERLAAVIIRAQFEADDAIHLLIARGEENQRRRPVTADAAAQLETVRIRQANIQNDAVKRLLLQGGKGGDAGVVPNNLPVLTRQRVSQRIGNGGIVFNQKNLFHGRIITWR